MDYMQFFFQCARCFLGDTCCADQTVCRSSALWSWATMSMTVIHQNGIEKGRATRLVSSFFPLPSGVEAKGLLTLTSGPVLPLLFIHHPTL